jgi:hypothetical protein
VHGGTLHQERHDVFHKIAGGSVPRTKEKERSLKTKRGTMLNIVPRFFLMNCVNQTSSLIGSRWSRMYCGRPAGSMNCVVCRSMPMLWYIVAWTSW